jgi:tRNA pseudouridine55 synthase
MMVVGPAVPARSGGMQRRRVNGLLLLDKPSGMTSNSALQRVKWLFHALKAGHTGSLDPLASGMLPICFGEATKLSSFLLESDKVYQVTARLGVQTDTGDADGAVTGTAPVPPLDAVALAAALVAFVGDVVQVPPMYSALKHEGRRLYSLARAGQQVPRQPRQIHISEFRLESFDQEQPVFRVSCSKGTYIRTLIEDLAKSLGTLAHVTALRRLAVGPFAEASMVTMSTLSDAAPESPTGLDRYLLPVDAVVAGWPAVRLDAAAGFRLQQGQPIAAPEAATAGLVRIYGNGGQFLGMGEVLADGTLRARRLMAQP